MHIQLTEQAREDLVFEESVAHPPRCCRHGQSVRQWLVEVQNPVEAIEGAVTN